MKTGTVTGGKSRRPSQWVPGVDALEDRRLLSQMAAPLTLPPPREFVARIAEISRESTSSTSETVSRPLFRADGPSWIESVPTARTILTFARSLAGNPEGASLEIRAKADGLAREGFAWDRPAVPPSKGDVNFKALAMTEKLEAIDRVSLVRTGPDSGFSPFTSQQTQFQLLKTSPMEFASGPPRANLPVVSLPSPITAPVSVKNVSHVSEVWAVSLSANRAAINAVSQMAPNRPWSFGGIFPQGTYEGIPIPDAQDGEAGEAIATPLSPDAIRTDHAQESVGLMETVFPLGSGLITAFSPFRGNLNLDATLARLLQDVDELGIALPEPAENLEMMIPIGVAMVAIEGARRWKKRRISPGVSRSWPSRSLLFSRFS